MANMHGYEPRRTSQLRTQSYRTYDGRLNGSRAVPRSVAGAMTHDATPARRRGFGRLFAAVFLISLLLGGYLAVQHHAAAQSASRTRERAAAEVARQARISSFGSQVNAVLQANSAVTFSVTAIDMTSGAQQHIGSSDAFDAASTGKLLTAAAFFHEVEQGQLNLQQTIDSQSAQTLLQQMITVSDDTAWLELNDTIGHDELATYAHSIGIVDYDPDSNLLGSNDVALVLQKLWAGTLMNANHQKLLLSWMQQANYRDFIVPAVPSADTVYHKAGEDEDNVHDAAIITNGQHTIALVIFSNGNGTYEWASRAALFQQITAAAIKDYL